MLPFDVLVEDQSRDFRLGSLLLPCYGSLTVAESIALSKLQIDEDAPIGCYYVDVAAIIVQSRTDKGYAYETTEDLKVELAKLPIHVLEALAGWVQNESSRWTDADEEPTEKKSQLTGVPSSGDSNLLTLTSLG